MPDNRALDIRVGSSWSSHKTGSTLTVIGRDITYEGDVLLQVSIEGGSRQLLEYEQLIKNWWEL